MNTMNSMLTTGDMLGGRGSIGDTDWQLELTRARNKAAETKSLYEDTSRVVVNTYNRLVEASEDQDKYYLQKIKTAELELELLKKQAQ